MSRHKTTVQIVLVAAMLLAVGTPAAAARGAEGRGKAKATRQEQHKAPSLKQWLKGKLSRYAMAAN